MMIIVCFCSKDKKSQSVECMQVKIDVAELRLTELTAELLRMTNEVQLIKVLTTDFSLQMEQGCCLVWKLYLKYDMFLIYHFYWYRMKQRLPLLKIVHWRQLVRQLKKQKRIQEKSPLWQRFNILFDFCSRHLTSTVSSLLLTFIMKRYSVWKQMYTLTALRLYQIKVQELVGQLLTEKQKNDEHAFQMEQMRQQIAQHE